MSIKLRHTIWMIAIATMAVFCVAQPAYAATHIYRSAGVTGTALDTGLADSNNLTISGTTAAFDIAVPDKVGVGDAIQYDSDNNGTIDAICFIHGRTSSTSLTVASASGGTPTATTVADQDWSIFRAYTSLYDAERGVENTGINDTVENFDTWSGGKDITISDEVWNIACYADGTDTTCVSLDGWITDADNYLRVFTPVSSSEVGTTQRHAGVWDDNKYNLSTTTATTNSISATTVAYLRIEGLQIKYGGGTSAWRSCINIGNSSPSDIRISHCILTRTGEVSGDPQTCLDLWATESLNGGTYRVWNNIIYGWNTGTGSNGIWLNHSGTIGYFYNNTVYDCTDGFDVSSLSTPILKNNIVHSCTDDYNGTFSSDSDYNLGEDAAFSGDSNYVQTTQTAAQIFNNPTNYDFHILSTSDAKDAGTNLLSDTNLSLSDDIDGAIRSGTWDIGADEISGSQDPTSFVNLTTTATTIQIDVPNRYRAIMNTGDTSDYLLFYDRAENDSAPDSVFEFNSFRIFDENVHYYLQYDDSRKTTIIETSSTRIRIRVEGCLDTSVGGSYLKDAAGGNDDVIEVTEEYTFTTEGVFIDREIDFKDGLQIDDVDYTDRVYTFLNYFNTSSPDTHSDTIYYGDGSSESSTGSSLNLSQTPDHYVVAQGLSNYQDIIMGTMEKDGDKILSNSTNGFIYYSTTSNRTGFDDYSQTLVGKGDAQFFLQFHDGLDGAGNEAEREAMFNDLTNPDILDFSGGTGSEWHDAPASPGLEFDGSNDYVEVDDVSSIQNLADNAFTYELWVYSEGVSASSQDLLFYKYSDTGGDTTIQLGIGDWGSGDQIEAYIITNGTSAGSVYAFPGGDASGWHHIAMRYDDAGDRKIDLIVDGVEVTQDDTAATGTVTDDSGEGLFIGGAGSTSYGACWDDEFKGRLDEIRLWNDWRSDAEIQQNMFKQVDPSSESNLVGYWRLNENTGTTAYDETTNNNDGTINNALWRTGFVPDHYNEAEGTYTVDASGSQVELDIDGGYGLEFDGTDDYVDVTHHSSLNLTSTLTIEAWVMRTDASTGYEPICQRQYASNSDIDSYYFGFNSDNKLHFGTYGGSIQSTQTTWTSGQWYHVVATYSSTGPTGKLYINGSEETLSVDNLDTMAGGTNELYIGYFTGTTYFDGYIDELRIWSDVRTASEIKHNMKKTLTGSEANLAAYWRFDEGSGQSVSDSSTNTNSGTLGADSGSSTDDPSWSSGYWAVRHTPMWKIRKYRSNTEPSTVTLEGTALTDGTDYNIDYKPISDAYFADELLWYSTLESEVAVTNPDVGSGATNSGAGFVTGKYGNGAELVDDYDDILIPITGGDASNFNKVKGAIEFWFQPKWDHNDNAAHILVNMYEDDNNRLVLQKGIDNAFEFVIYANSTVIKEYISSTYYSWKVNDWVHLRAEWDDTASAANQQKVFMNGIEPFADSDADDYNSTNLTLDTYLRIGTSNTYESDAIIDEFRIYGGASTEPDDLAAGGDTADSDEYLADTTNNYTLDFVQVDASNRGEYLFIGSDSMFSGVNVDLETNGAGASVIFEDGFESGNLTTWDSSSGADISASIASAYAGTYGMQVVYDDVTADYVQDNLNNTEVYVRVYINPNGATLRSAWNGDFVFLQFSDVGTNDYVCEVGIKANATSGYDIRLIGQDDLENWYTGGTILENYTNVTDDWHLVEVRFKSATGAGQNDGIVSLWIDGNHIGTLTNLDTDTFTIDRARLGVVRGMDATDSGTIYFDGYVSGGMVFDWEYWDGDSWATLRNIKGFSDGTSNFTQDGAVYWTANPTNWRRYSVNGSTDLYYIRASLNSSSGSYSTNPIENFIKTDILTFQYLSNISSNDQTLYIGPVTNTTPTAPTGLSPASGGGTTDTTPTLEFTQDDADAEDTVKYRIQIDDTSDFSSLVVDYTSALMADGATSFTVGQAEGTGTYTVGAADQTLSDASYYWRVSSTDNNDASSGWATANSGSVAFIVDNVDPTTTFGSTSESGAGTAYTYPNSQTVYFSEGMSTTATQVTITVTAADTGGSGIAKVNFGAFNDESAEDDTESPYSRTYNITSADSAGTINITSYDNAGNSDASPVSITMTKDITAPSAVGAPTFGTITTTSIVINKPSTVTETGAGLYQWQARRDSATNLGWQAVGTTTDTDSSLSINIQYTYDVQFSDNVGNESSFGTSAAKYTSASQPTASAFTNVTSTSIQANWGANSNPAGTEYYCEYDEGTSFVAQEGSSGWITNTYWNKTGLAENTSYSFRVRARNGDGDTSDWTDLTYATTSAGAPSITQITRLFDNEKIADTTPAFVFTGTDPESVDVDYELRWDTDYNFGTATTKASVNYSTDVGWTAATFTSGASVTYTVQAGDAFTDNTTYWWQIRVRDPAGSNTWSSWTTARSFTIDTTVTVPTWFQTTQEQFDTDTATGSVQPEATDDVRMSGP